MGTNKSGERGMVVCPQCRAGVGDLRMHTGQADRQTGISFGLLVNSSVKAPSLFCTFFFLIVNFLPGRMLGNKKERKRFFKQAP